IHGFKIPGLIDEIKLTLFADDTTVYLPKTARLHNLTESLSMWCTASGAKFNTEKTEIIPIGSKMHRLTVLATRRLHQDDDPLPTSIHIVKDGEAIRSLGAWIGNNTNDATPWEAIIDKIAQHLTYLARGHPTLFSKTYMVQQTVGGMTQYLAKVQGMPPNIVTALEKLIRIFIWEDAATNPPVALSQLYMPKENGGLD
ncbi:hypothetical protein GLOTRDRAFT_21383, partial [Gloeophyllum trabeum ATCC 11539]